MKFDAAAVRALAAQMNVDVDSAAAHLTEAFAQAYQRTSGADPDATVELDVHAGTLTVLDAAGADITPRGFDRAAATAARQAVQMWMRDVERIRKVGVWAHREGTLLEAPVRAHAARNARGEVIFDAGAGVDVVMPSGEATPGEAYVAPTRMRTLIMAVNATDRGGVRLTVSRRQPALVSALLADVVPELAAGTVQIAAIARDPGSRTKIAVRSLTAGVDAAAAIIGPRGSRIRTVADELRGEKIDVVAVTDDLADFVAAAFTPAAVLSAQVTDAHRRCVQVRVASGDYAAAVGAGQANVRLVQRLTGARVEVVPVTS